MSIRIFVGSDIWQFRAGAETVLEHSIRQHTKANVEFTWMRAGPKGHADTARGFEVSEHGESGTWKIHRPVHHAWPKKGWGTPFSNFRSAVPELLGFEGVGVYLDADMIVLGDVEELIAYPRMAAWFCNHQIITDVSVIEGAPFKDCHWWPSIHTMMKQGMFLKQCLALLNAHNYMDTRLPWEWNMRDRWTPQTRLLHYTSVPQQVWTPYPDVKYIPHHDPKAEPLWWGAYGEALAVEHGATEAVRLLREAHAASQERVKKHLR